MLLNPIHCIQAAEDTQDAGADGERRQGPVLHHDGKQGEEEPHASQTEVTVNLLPFFVFNV